MYFILIAAIGAKLLADPKHYPTLRECNQAALTAVVHGSAKAAYCKREDEA